MRAMPKYACCTFSGSVVALRISDGRQLWKTYLVDPPKAHGKDGARRGGVRTIRRRRLVDADRGYEAPALYVATSDNYSVPASSMSDAVMALDLASGRIVWSKQFTPGDVFSGACPSKATSCPDGPGPDFDFAASTILDGAARRWRRAAGGAEVRDRVRARSGQAGRGALADARRQGRDERRHPVGHGRRRRSGSTPRCPTWTVRSRIGRSIRSASSSNAASVAAQRA